MTIEQVVRDQIAARRRRRCRRTSSRAPTPTPSPPTSHRSPANPSAAPAKNATSGKDIFVANCGSCHTLADAGTSGNVGPNLDQLKPAESIVQHQVINGGGAMPAFKGQADPGSDHGVAKYVSSVAGKG